MADTNKPKKRRIIRKVETVREKAEKISALPAKKPGILRLAGRYITKPFRPIGRQFAKLGRFKFFRVIGLILVPRYFRNSWKELRLVTWPTRRETLQLTLAVIIFAVIFGALITVVDIGLDKVFKQVLLN